MKTLVAVDGSDRNQRLPTFLAANAAWRATGHALHFLTVGQPMSARVAGFLDRAAIDRVDAEEAERVLEPVRAFAEQHRWAYRATLLTGPAAETAARTAEAARSEPVAMGLHGHGALANVVLGSVAGGVLARCKVPLLRIR